MGGCGWGRFCRELFLLCVLQRVVVSVCVGLCGSWISGCRLHCNGCMNVAWSMFWGGSRSTKPCVFPPQLTTSLPHHFPSSPLPFVTTSLRHHFPSSPPRHCQHPSPRSIPPLLILLFCIVMFCCYVIYHLWSTTLQSQFHRFLFFCYVLLCDVLLYDLPPFIISSLRILFVRNTEVLLPNFLWLSLFSFL